MPEPHKTAAEFSMRERLLRAGFVALTVTASAVAAAFAPQIQEGVLGGRFSGPAGVAAPDRSALEKLQAELELERERRTQLAAQIDQLQTQVASLARERRRPPRRAAAAPDLSADQRDASESEAAAERRPRWRPEEREARRRERREARRQQMLAEAGLDEEAAEQLRQRYEAAQLERLYLRDRAGRDGVSPQELREAERDLERSLREDLGADYDAMLFATGQRNRVEIQRAMPGSAAEVAGLQSGDLILSYAGQPVYQPRDLNRLTRQGEFGQLVSLQVQRGTRVFSVRFPRGPIGANLRAVRRPPLR